MLTYPHIDPVAFKIGPLPVHWYGLMYLVGFVSAWCLALWRARHPDSDWSSEQISDLIFYSAIGVIVGGRVGYMLFYDFPALVRQPFTLFEIWNGGMSFHGGVLGVGLATWVYARVHHRPWIRVIDFVVPLVPIGLGAGRLGNFINGELWGRVTHVPWAMVFPAAGPLPRHPSQLYEFVFEGVVLFTIVWFYSAKNRPPFAVTALFLLCYGCLRFALEFLRQPDPQLGFIAFGWLTAGQLLSLPMILSGGMSLWWVCQRKKPQ